MSDAQNERPRRHLAEHRVVLLLSGDSGPAVHTGVTVEVGLGGCTLQLDDVLLVERGVRSGVLTVLVDGVEIPALTGAPSRDDESERCVRLTLQPSNEGSSVWAEWIHSLEERDDRLALD
jgi:hypothetical protein